MDIQTEVQKIHHQFGVTEKANYEIQKLFDKAIKEAVTEALRKHAVMRCGLSEVEFTERERLLELQRSTTRWFSQQEFDRLKELSDKMFANAGSPHSA